MNVSRGLGISSITIVLGMTFSRSVCFFRQSVRSAVSFWYGSSWLSR